jgi:hypothetical protein
MSITNSGSAINFSKPLVCQSVTSPIVTCDLNLKIPTTQVSGEIGVTGSLCFNTDSNTLNVFNGSSWVSTPGPTGQAGPAGSNGSQGPAGSQGPQGIQGIQGIQGPAGSNGSGGPAFSAYASGQQTNIGSNVIIFNSEEFDTANTYDTSNSRWTPGVEGYYQINALVTSRFDTGGAGDVYINLRKNGTVIKSSTRFASSASFIQPSINTIVYLTDTDYIDIYGSTTTRFDTNPVFGGGTNQLWVYFNGCFLKSA